MENQKSQRKNDVVRNILFVLNRHKFLIIAIILLCTVAGLFYGVLKKPTYSVNARVVYNVQTVSGDTSSGYTGTVVANAYIDTIAKFCSEGYVVDRADFYYNLYSKNKAQYLEEYYENKETYDEKYNKDVAESKYKTSMAVFLDKIRSNDPSVEMVKDGSKPSEGKGDIKSSSIVVEYESNSSHKDFILLITYKDADKSVINDKLTIFIEAIRVEANMTDANSDSMTYFGKVKTYLEDLGHSGIGSNVSVPKLVFLFLAGGVVLSLILVYVINLFDNSVKDQDELENIIDANVLAFITK